MCSCVEVIQERHIKKARKEYRCMSSENVREFVYKQTGTDISFADFRKIVKAKREDWKILKDQPYLRQTNKMEGNVYDYICRKDMHEICCKYKLYMDCC